MAWCPNCKMEYQDGIKSCTDCGVDLLDNLEDTSHNLESRTELVDLVNEEDARKFVDFLNYSNIKNVSLEYFEETSSWKVSINNEDTKEAIKLYKAFRIAETSEEEKLEEIKKIKEAKITTSSYVKKEDKYNDFKSSVTVFIPFGMIGLIFVVLNMTNTLHFLTSPVQIIVLTIFFIGSIIVGITSFLKLKVIKEEIKKEQDNTSSITEWMLQNITPDILSTVTDESKPDEVNYIHQTDKMKEMILNQFGDMDEDFVEQLVEDYYNEQIDK